MEKFAKLIRQHQYFLITTHALPDGDGLGSAMALHLYLKKSGKKSIVLNPSPTPDKFKLVDPHSKIRVYQPGDAIPKTEVVFVVDTNELKMLGALEKPIEGLKAKVVFVDHHVPDMDGLDEHLIDEQYSSTGELIYSFLRHMKADVDAEMALAIYVAIVTDTASFRYKRTTARSHEVAAELLKKGVLPEKVYHQIYSRDSFGKIRLLGNILENLKSSDDGRIAWVVVTQAMMKKYQATVEDTEAYIGHLTHLQGVEIALLFREEEDGRIKISVRGNGEVPVFGIAKRFGGGGHRHAAGARIAGKIDDVVQQVIQEAKGVLN